jgi:hypothetical protein
VGVDELDFVVGYLELVVMGWIFSLGVLVSLVSYSFSLFCRNIVIPYSSKHICFSLKNKVFLLN